MLIGPCALTTLGAATVAAVATAAPLRNLRRVATADGDLVGIPSSLVSELRDDVLRHLLRLTRPNSTYSSRAGCRRGYRPTQGSNCLAPRDTRAHAAKVNNSGLTAAVVDYQSKVSAVAGWGFGGLMLKLKMGTARSDPRLPPVKRDDRPIQAELIGSAIAQAQFRSAAGRQEKPRVTPPFDARHHLAACSSVFLFRGPLGWPRSIGHGHRHRALGRGHQRHAQSVVQPLLQRAAGAQLGQLRFGAVVLLCPGRGLRRAGGVSTLPQSMAADPVAALDD